MTSTISKVSLFSLPSPYLFGLSYLYPYRLKDSFFIWCVQVYSCHYWFWCSNIYLIWPVDSLSSWPLYLFDTSPSVFELFLTFWHSVFQVPFVLSLSLPWIQPFVQRALIPFTREWYLEIKSWMLGGVATGVSLLLDRFQQTELSSRFYLKIMSSFFLHVFFLPWWEHWFYLV